MPTSLNKCGKSWIRNNGFLVEIVKSANEDIVIQRVKLTSVFGEKYSQKETENKKAING